MRLQLSSMGSTAQQVAATIDEVDYEYGMSVNLSTRNRCVRDMVNYYRQETNNSRDPFAKSPLSFDQHRSDKVHPIH